MGSLNRFFEPVCKKSSVDGDPARIIDSVPRGIGVEFEYLQPLDWGKNGSDCNGFQDLVQEVDNRSLSRGSFTCKPGREDAAYGSPCWGFQKEEIRPFTPSEAVGAANFDVQKGTVLTCNTGRPAAEGQNDCSRKVDH